MVTEEGVKDGCICEAFAKTLTSGRGFRFSAPFFWGTIFYTNFVCTLKKVFPFNLPPLTYFFPVSSFFCVNSPIQQFKSLVWAFPFFSIIFWVGSVFPFRKKFGFSFCIIWILILFDFYSWFLYTTCWLYILSSFLLIPFSFLIFAFVTFLPFLYFRFTWLYPSLGYLRF